TSYVLSDRKDDARQGHAGRREGVGAMRPQTHVPRRGAVFLLGLARTLGLCLLTYFGSGFFAAQAAESRLPAAQETRLRELTRELRCLVCQNESLAESHAPLAADLRE